MELSDLRQALAFPATRIIEAGGDLFAVHDPDADHDLTALDVVMPHPVYGGMHWVCVLNPDRTWPLVAQLLAEAHAYAVRKHERHQVS